MDRRMSDEDTTYCADEGQNPKTLDDSREEDTEETTSGVVSVRESSYSPEPEYNYRMRRLNPRDEAEIRRLGQEMVWDRLGLRLSESPPNSSGEQDDPSPSTSKIMSPPIIQPTTYDWPVLTTTPVSSRSPSREDVRTPPSKPDPFPEAPLLLSEFAIIPALPDDSPPIQSPSWRTPSPMAVSPEVLDDEIDLPSEKGVMRRRVNPRRSATPYTIPRRRGIRVRGENKKLNADDFANNR